MANSKDASKAANLIKSHKIDAKLVPQVGERLNKNMVRHFYKTSGW
jgi:predicted Fe-Mo cluster-binding NifX family protein